MSTASTVDCQEESSAGALLADLERRQDEVLAQLEALDQQLTSILRGLGVTLLDDGEPSAAPAADAAPAAEPGRGSAPSPGFTKLPFDRPTAAPATRVA